MYYISHHIAWRQSEFQLLLKEYPFFLLFALPGKGKRYLRKMRPEREGITRNSAESQRNLQPSLVQASFLGRHVDGPSNAANPAPSRGFAPAVRSRDSDTVVAGFVPDPDAGVLTYGQQDAPVGGSSCLLDTLECPEQSVVVCVDGVLASVGVAQACKDARRGVLRRS